MFQVYFIETMATDATTVKLKINKKNNKKQTNNPFS